MFVLSLNVLNVSLSQVGARPEVYHETLVKLGHELVAIQKQVYLNRSIFKPYQLSLICVCIICLRDFRCAHVLQCKPLLSKLESYKELPADHTLARVQVEKANSQFDL